MDWSDGRLRGSLCCKGKSQDIEFGQDMVDLAFSQLIHYPSRFFVHYLTKTGLCGRSRRVYSIALSNFPDS